MSKRLINLNADLKRLREEGYDLDIQYGFLFVRDVPYVGADSNLKRGTLVSTLVLAGEATVQPIDDHTMKFIGEFPCDKNGTPLEQFRHGTEQSIANGLMANYSFSRKKVGQLPYSDYHEKVTTYVAELEVHAQAIDQYASARTFPPIVPDDEEPSLFKYLENASSKAGIVAASEKLALKSVAIVGLGGTGSYVLDLVAKTHVEQIHLYDRDVFLTHNAFRGPGAPTLEELQAKPTKVSYWAEQYSKMREGIIGHPYHLDESNLDELQDIQFIFVCIDSGIAKKTIVEALENFGKPFIDVGMGIELRNNNSLGGILRVTLSEPERRDLFRTRVSLGDARADDEYEDDIQVADLNSLNASMAVMRWKQFYGFYDDFQSSLQVTLTLDTNMMLNEDL